MMICTKVWISESGRYYKLELLKLAAKLTNNLLPETTKRFFHLEQNIHTDNTRNRNYARPFNYTTSIFNKSLFNRAIIKLTRLPVAVKNINYIKTLCKRNEVRCYRCLRSSAVAVLGGCGFWYWSLMSNICSHVMLTFHH